ncbi:hypothetical protein Vretifemale_17742 [Volvox reticuliferus]|nr:hypothetical protein Vretifemale_17742 [Volvox reticuliferus]
MPCLNGSRLDAQLAAAALTLLVLLCACARGADAGRKHSSSPPPPPGPPKEICGRTIVVTELFNQDNLVTPAGIDISSMTDLSSFVGYQLGYVDDMFLGSSASNLSTPVGTVTSICYFLSTVNNYCTSTLSFGSFGDITFVGPFNDVSGNGFQNAIAGGTGIFTGAQGSVTINVLNGGQAWLTTVGLLKAPKCT